MNSSSQNSGPNDPSDPNASASIESSFAPKKDISSGEASKAAWGDIFKPTNTSLPSFLPREQKKKDSPGINETVQASAPLLASSTQTQSKPFAFGQSMSSGSGNLFSKVLDKPSNPLATSSSSEGTGSTPNLFNVTKSTPNPFMSGSAPNQTNPSQGSSSLFGGKTFTPMTTYKPKQETPQVTAQNDSEEKTSTTLTLNKVPVSSGPEKTQDKVNTDAKQEPQMKDKAAPGNIFATQKPPAQGTSNLFGSKVNTDTEKESQKKDKAAPGDIFATQKPLAQGTSSLFGSKVNTDAEQEPQKKDKAAPGDIFATQKPPAQGTSNLFGSKVNTDTEKESQKKDKAAPGDIFATQKPLAQGTSSLFGSKVNTDTEKKPEEVKLSSEDKAAPGNIFNTQNPPAQGSSNLFSGFTLPKNESVTREPAQADDNKQTQSAFGKMAWGTMNPGQGSTNIFTKLPSQPQNLNPSSSGVFGTGTIKTNNETPNKPEGLTSVASESKPATAIGGLFGNIQKSQPLGSGPPVGGIFGTIKSKPDTEATSKPESLASVTPETKPATTIGGGLFGNLSKSQSTGGTGLLSTMNTSASGSQGSQSLLSSSGLTQPINPTTATPIVVGSQFTLGPGLTKVPNQPTTQGGPLIKASAPVKGEKVVPDSTPLFKEGPTGFKSVIQNFSSNEKPLENTIFSKPPTIPSGNLFQTSKGGPSGVGLMSSINQGTSIKSLPTTFQSPFDTNKKDSGMNLFAGVKKDIGQGGLLGNNLIQKNQTAPQTKSAVEPSLVDAKIEEFRKLVPKMKSIQSMEKTFEEAYKKESKVKRKIEQIVKEIDTNFQGATQFKKDQEVQIDKFFDEFEVELTRKLILFANEYRKKFKDQLQKDLGEYSETSERLKKQLQSLVEKDSFSNVFENTKRNEQVSNLASAIASKLSTNAETVLKSYLSESFELKVGFTPLVKKYKLIKFAIPSLRILNTSFNEKIMLSADLTKSVEKIYEDFEKIFASLNSRLGHKIEKFSHPMKPYLETIDNYINSKSSIVPTSFLSSDSEKLAANVNEVVHELTAREVAFVNTGEIFENNEDHTVSYHKKSVSVHYDMRKGDLLSLHDVPHKIVYKDFKSPNDVVELENVLTGELQRIEFHSGWDQGQDLVLTDTYIMTKAKQTRKGYYKLFNTDDEVEDTRSQLKIIKAGHVLTRKLTQDLAENLERESKVKVHTLVSHHKELIVAFNNFGGASF